jgi:hypothetical protein
MLGGRIKVRGERKKSGDARRGPLLVHCSLLITCMHDTPSSRVRFSVERTDSVEEFRSIDSSLQSIPPCNPFQHALEFAVSPRRLTPSHSDGSLARWLAMIASRGVPCRIRQPAGTNHRRARVPPALGDHAYARQLNRLCRAPAAALDSSAAVRSRRTSPAVGGGEPARVESSPAPNPSAPTPGPPQPALWLSTACGQCAKCRWASSAHRSETPRETWNV